MPLRREVADDLPGPVHLAEPAAHRRHDHRGTVQGAGGRADRRRQDGRPGAHGARRAQPRALQPLPERVLRRPAPAHRHRPRASRCAPSSSSATSRSRRSTSRSRRRSSTCSRTSRTSSGSPTSSSPTTSPSSATSPTGSRSCTSARSWSSPTATSSTRRPLHPYTHALLSAVPVPDPDGSAQARADPAHRATCPARSTRRRGCVFHTRCWKAQERCARRGAAAARAAPRPPASPATSRSRPSPAASSADAPRSIAARSLPDEVDQPRLGGSRSRRLDAPQRIEPARTDIR